MVLIRLPPSVATHRLYYHMREGETKDQGVRSEAQELHWRCLPAGNYKAYQFMNK